MPHGAPDWSNVVKPTVVHRLDDMAEAVVRLGSIITFDRRGDIVWFDSFEYGHQHYDKWLSGTGAKVEISTETFRNHGYSLKLTAGSDASRAAQIIKNFPIIESGPHGAEFSWYLYSYPWAVDLRIEGRDKNKEFKFEVYYHLGERKLYYIDENNILVVLDDDLSIVLTWSLFHTWKLVWNTKTGYYIRLLFDDRTYDMSDKKGYVTTYIAADYYKVALTQYGQAGVNSISYFDDAIFTINEPV